MSSRSSRGSIAVAQQLDQESGVDVTRARAHHQAFERRHPHAGLDAATVLDGGDARAVTEMARHDPERLRRRREPLRNLRHHVRVAETVKAVPAGAVAGADGFGQRVLARPPRQGAVERGIEHRDVRDAGEGLARALQRSEGRRIVQRRQAAEVLELPGHAVVHQNRGAKALPAVNDAMHDGLDGGIRPQSAPHLLEHHRRRRTDVATGRERPIDAVDPQDGRRLADAGDAEVEKPPTARAVDQRALDRGAAAVDGEDAHAPSPVQIEFLWL